MSHLTKIQKNFADNEELKAQIVEAQQNIVETKQKLRNLIVALVSELPPATVHRITNEIHA